MIGAMAEHCLIEAVKNLEAAELCLKFPPKPEYKHDSDVMLIFVERILETLLDATLGLNQSVEENCAQIN